MKRLPKEFARIPAQEQGAEAVSSAMEEGLGGFMLADEMGSGKTLMALMALGDINDAYDDQGGVKTLIVAPVSLLWVWQEMVEKFMGERSCVVARSGVREGFAADAPVVVTNYEGLRRPESREALRKWLNAKKDPVIILDEAHRVKCSGGKPAQQTAAVWGMPSSPKNPEGVVGLASGAFVIGLSGTPTPNGRHKEAFYWLRHIMRDETCWRSDWSAYRKFSEVFCGGRLGPIPGRPGAKRWLDNDNTYRDLFRELVGKCLLRRTKEAFADLPQKRRRIIRYPASEALDSSIRASLAGVKEDILLENIVEKGKAGPQGVEAFREIAVFKSALAASHAAELFDDDPSSPIIIFGHHREAHRNMLELLRKQKRRVVSVYGGTSDKDARQAIDDIQEGRADFMVASYKCMAEGITLTAANRVVMAELPMVPSDIAQAEDRVHRIGQENAVISDWITVMDSIDDRLARMLQRKIANAEAMLPSEGKRQAGEPPKPRSAPGRKAGEDAADERKRVAKTAAMFGLEPFEGKAWWKRVSAMLARGESLETIEMIASTQKHIKFMRRMMADQGLIK